MSKGPPAARFRQFDGLRALAIVSVVIIHSLQTISLKTADYFPGGSGGVDLFFALSGFLITYLLLGEATRTGTISLSGFYVRRGLRLVPALVVMLIAQAAWSFAVNHPAGEELRSLAMVITYISNFGYAYSSISPDLAHTWSLAVEMQFYLVWPLLLYWLLRRGWTPSRIARLAAGIAVLGALDSALSWHLTPRWWELYVRPDIRVTTLMAGAAVAAFVKYQVPDPRKVRVAAFAGWAVYLTFLFVARGYAAPFYEWQMFALAIASSAMVLGAALEVGPFGSVLTNRVVQWLGERSYGLYLWHVPIVDASVHFRGVPWPVRIGLAWVLALVVTAASYRWIEQPFLRRKSQLSARRQSERTPPQSLSGMGARPPVGISRGVDVSGIPLD